MDKKTLREKYIKIRKDIKNKEEKSELIKENLKKLDDYNKAKKVGIYYSMENEVDTKPIIKDLIGRKKEVYLPKVIGENMTFIKINSIDFDKEKTDFGVIEPIYESKNELKGNLDIIIIPGICFDIDKNRVGFGKGFYDKYLENRNIKKISICFDKQLLINDKIQINKNDIKMDIVITEKRMF